MVTYRRPSSASYHARSRQDRSALPKSTSRHSRVRNPSIIYNDTLGSTRRQTSNDTSFNSTRHEKSLHGRRTSRSHQHDRSRYGPNPGSSVSDRRRTRDPTHTFEPSQGVSWFRDGNNSDRPQTETTKRHIPPLNSTLPKSCLKRAKASDSCLPNVNHTQTETLYKNNTGRGQSSISPLYINGGKSQHLHHTSHDSWTLASNLFNRSQNAPSSLRTEAPRTRTVYYHKSRREPKKKKRNKKHKRREPTNDFPDSTDPRYTQRTRHRRKHATEWSGNPHEKRHNRRTHRQVTERHTSCLEPMRNNTRPSVIRTKQRTKHQRARHPSEASERYAPRTARTRTHHARASRNRCAPRCREIPTTRTQGYRYR
jgi:hypothetical protein